MEIELNREEILSNCVVTLQLNGFNSKIDLNALQTIFGLNRECPFIFPGYSYKYPEYDFAGIFFS